MGTVRRQRGISLTELLVSITVLALAMVISLVLYDGARRSFKVGDNLTEQQQVVRIAFDTIASDLRAAGFNYNPDGTPGRPDEQLEAIYDTAIVFRADFDGQREEPYATGGAFEAVSVANDEIVTYALVKSGGPNDDTVSFVADISMPRNGGVTPVDVPGIDLDQDNPPYTLYRFALNDGGSVVSTPLIDNVRSLRFTYYDAADRVVPAALGIDTELARAERASIRRIGLEVEVLTRDRDPRWVDADDPDPLTRAFRKFKLSGDVVPRNLGRVAVKDVRADVTPPPTPGRPTLYDGHCGGFYITWPPNPAYDPVAYYRILFGTSSGDLSGRRASVPSEYYLGGLLDDQRYYVAVQAVDLAGNVSPSSSPIVDLKTRNVLPQNTPSKTLGATTDSVPANGAVRLTWDAVTTNIGTTTGDPLAPLLRDLAGYRIYRKEDNPDFSGGGTLIADVGPLSDPVFFDTEVVNCQDYYYAVAAVDDCGVTGDLSDGVDGRAETTLKPRFPLNAEAFVADYNSSDEIDQVRLKWTPVREDVDGNSIYIADYNILWTGVIPTSPLPSVPEDFFPLDSVHDGSTEYIHNVTVGAGQTVYYLLTAVDRCSPPNESDVSFSSMATLPQPTCEFSGDVVFVEPAYGSQLQGTVRFELDVTGGSGTYQGNKLRFFNEQVGASSVFEIPLSGAGPWIYYWNTFGQDAGAWRIRGEVDQIGGPVPCTQSRTIRVIQPEP